MKRLLFLTAVIFSALMLTGCSDSTELGSRAVIQAIAVDYDNGYKISALMFSSGGSGGNTIDASQDNVIKVEGEGKTLSEAIDNISLVDGKRIYMCETKLLVLGKGFERIDVSDALNTLYYDLRCSLNMPVCCADDPDLLTDLQFTEGITSAEKPLSIIENAYEMGASPKTMLLDLLADRAAGRSSLIPGFSQTKNGRGMTKGNEGNTAVLSGSRSISDGRLAGRYDRAETAGLMLINGLSDKIRLNYRHDGIEKTCEAYSVKVKTDGLPSQNGGVKVSAKFRTRNGSSLSEEERLSALEALNAIVKNGM